MNVSVVGGFWKALLYLSRLIVKLSENNPDKIFTPWGKFKLSSCIPHMHIFGSKNKRDLTTIGIKRNLRITIRIGGGKNV